MSLIEFTNKGVYCSRANVYIDPSRKVKNAIITHGHSDHARPGHENYLCVDASAPILKHRLGKIGLEFIPYSKVIKINGVSVSFHPAGHVVGSAQIRLEYKGEVAVVSGDYKLENDGISEAYEVVKCNTFVTESTFALPIYQWQPQEKIYHEINDWWLKNNRDGKTSLISAYSLGKAQRLLANIDESIGKIFCHEAISKMNKVLIENGVMLPETYSLNQNTSPKETEGALILGPPSALGNSWNKFIGKIEIAAASGWNQLRTRRKSKALDKAFVLSDHADWSGLNKAVKDSEAENVYVTHGYSEVFSKYLCEQGLNATAV